MNIGFAELILVLVIAYVIVGPKDLPKVARWLGRLVRRARALIRELKEEVGWNEMMAETEDVRRDIDSAIKDADVTAELKDAKKQLQQSLTEAEKGEICHICDEALERYCGHNLKYCAYLSMTNTSYKTCYNLFHRKGLMR